MWSEAGRALIARPAWSTQCVPGHPRLQGEAVSEDMAGFGSWFQFMDCIALCAVAEQSRAAREERVAQSACTFQRGSALKILP